jgi:hypothetical protein
MKTHSAPYVPLAMNREQIAEHIKAGFPSQVRYTAYRLVRFAPGYVTPVDATPVHLRRA